MSTDKQTIQSYDDHAAEWSQRMKNKKSLAHDHLEKPAMYAKLPNLDGKNVLCVGCGSGEECDYIKKQGAEKVVGIDISKGLIEQAKYAYPEIEFYAQDVEEINFEQNSFDLVYSSLAFHYLRNWERALGNIKKALKDDGIVLISTHHPVYWGANESKMGSRGVHTLGYSIDNKSSENFEIYGDYFTSRLIKDTWFGTMKVNYYHKPISEIFQEIKSSGFVVTDFLEPKSLPSSQKIKKDFFEIHQKIPLFMIFELKKAK